MAYYPGGCTAAQLPHDQHVSQAKRPALTAQVGHQLQKNVDPQTPIQ
jgi:hypothetical protein